MNELKVVTRLRFKNDLKTLQNKDFLHSQADFVLLDYAKDFDTRFAAQF